MNNFKPSLWMTIFISFFLVSIISCRVTGPSSPSVAVPDRQATIDPPDADGNVDSLSYFAMGVPGSPCVAEDPSDSTTYSRISLLPNHNCSPRKPLYLWLKSWWASETFFVEDNFLKSIEEVEYDENRNVTNFRTFRDLNSGRKGVNGLPLKVNVQGESWEYDPHVEEYWTNAQGKPACHGGVEPNPVDGSSYKAELYLTTLPGWLQDRRSTSIDPNRWHDVQALVLIDYWGDNHKEHYYYGKWVNPATGRSEGLSLVKWEWYEGRKKKSSANHRYLVDCTLPAPCWNCYDP